MSLMIDIDKVSHVLLADGWHEVYEESFLLDAYEFVERGDDPASFEIVHGGGRSGICATGFSFREVWDADAGSRTQTKVISGPLTSILAVRA